MKRKHYCIPELRVEPVGAADLLTLSDGNDGFGEIGDYQI